MRHGVHHRREQGIRVDLQCEECHRRESLSLLAQDFKALSVSWRLARDCSTCRRRTGWTFAEAAVGAEEQQDFWDWLATTGEHFEEPRPAPQDERRSEPRIEVQVSLLVTDTRGENEEVISKDISRKGLCFPSRKSYSPGDQVQITLRPAGAAAPVRRRAVVVRSAPAADGQMLYGVRLEGQPDETFGKVSAQDLSEG